MERRFGDLYRTKRISIIVPIYNGEASIASNIAIIEREIAPYFDNWEIIVVSDGSTDATYERALEKASSHVRVCRYHHNQGKGFALRYGFKRSRGDYIIFIDGDLELRPREIRSFLALMDVYEADAVIGSKRHPQSEVDYPLTRRVLSRIYQMIVAATMGLNVRDTQVGLKLFKREVLADALERVLIKKFAFDLELLTVAHHLGYTKILEAPIKLDYKAWQKGKGLANFIRVFRMGYHLGVDMLAIIYRMRILRYYDHNRSARRRLRRMRHAASHAPQPAPASTSEIGPGDVMPAPVVDEIPEPKGNLVGEVTR